MEQDNRKVAWGKALKPIFALMLVIVLWQVLVLEMLKNGIISTLIAVVLVSAVSVDRSCAGKCGQRCDFWSRILGCEITAEPVSYNSPGKNRR